MTKVKICGLKRLEDAMVAADAGADFLGFVFAPSRRQVTAESVSDIVSTVSAAHPAVKMVGVFVNSDSQELNRVARLAKLDYVQLHGDEPPEIHSALDVPAIQTIRVSLGTTKDEIKQRASESGAEILLLDTADPQQYGGTGKNFDWDRVPHFDRPVLLGGGLNHSNVSEAMRCIKPWGLDVSSGVETDGEKDQAKIRDFIHAARS